MDHNKDTSPMEQFSAFFRGLQLPAVELNEIIAGQKKNIEAFTKAMQSASEGANAVARRQAEILKAALEEASKMMRDLTVPGNPKETVVKQVELIKRTFETAVANARELALMIEKSNKEAFDVIGKRTSETLEEIRKSLLKKK
ncbi:MAG TPA: TIGR01841 family phasin [Stellaceae bacterium]|nr:TIGR01841 family phasin [Stellaceae bacterium]